MEFWSAQQWRDFDKQFCEEIKKKESMKRKRKQKNKENNIHSKPTDSNSNLRKPVNKKDDLGENKQEQDHKNKEIVNIETSPNEQRNEEQVKIIEYDKDKSDEDEWQATKYPTPRMIFRGGWAARPPKPGLEPLRHPVSRIIFTFTGGDECFSDEECTSVVQRLQQQHMAQGMPDIQFNFLVGGDKCVYEGRGWLSKATKKSVHSLYVNDDTIDIAYIGDFADKDPADAVIEAGNGILQVGVNQGYLNQEIDITSIREEQTEDVVFSEMAKQKEEPSP